MQTGTLVRWVVVAALLLTPSPAATQTAAQMEVMNSGRRTMTAERMREGERIVLDGVLDEPAWGRAKHGGEFVMQDPVLGGTPTERTEIRVLFNADHLYIGATLFDSEPDKLKGNTRKRDEFLSADDRFMWTIDTFLNQQTGYFFEMNPAGLMADALMGPGGTTRGSGTASGTRGSSRATSAGSSRSTSRSGRSPSIRTPRRGASTSSARCAARRKNSCGPAINAIRACGAWPMPDCSWA